MSGTGHPPHQQSAWFVPASTTASVASSGSLLQVPAPAGRLRTSSAPDPAASGSDSGSSPESLHERERVATFSHSPFDAPSLSQVAAAAAVPFTYGGTGLTFEQLLIASRLGMMGAQAIPQLSAAAGSAEAAAMALGFPLLPVISPFTAPLLSTAASFSVSAAASASASERLPGLSSLKRKLEEQRLAHSARLDAPKLEASNPLGLSPDERIGAGADRFSLQQREECDEFEMGGGFGERDARGSTSSGTASVPGTRGASPTALQRLTQKERFEATFEPCSVCGDKSSGARAVAHFSRDTRLASHRTRTLVQ